MQWPPVVLVAHFPSCHTFYHSVFLSLSLSLVLQFPLLSPPSLSPLQTHARLASSSFLALLGFTHPRRPSRSRPSDAHGAYNFHIVPSRSQPSAGERARRLSRARGGADEGERRPLKSSWEPITRVTQGRTHRAARRGAAAAPKILLRPRALGDRLKSRITIIGTRCGKGAGVGGLSA